MRFAFACKACSAFIHETLSALVGCSLDEWDDREHLTDPVKHAVLDTGGTKRRTIDADVKAELVLRAKKRRSSANTVAGCAIGEGIDFS